MGTIGHGAVSGEREHSYQGARSELFVDRHGAAL
jgi:hypothetical protein